MITTYIGLQTERNGFGKEFGFVFVCPFLLFSFYFSSDPNKNGGRNRVIRSVILYVRKLS